MSRPPVSEYPALLALTQATASLLTRGGFGMRSSETVNELALVLQGKYRLGRELHASLWRDSLINEDTGHWGAHLPMPSSNLALLIHLRCSELIHLILIIPSATHRTGPSPSLSLPFHLVLAVSNSVSPCVSVSTQEQM